MAVYSGTYISDQDIIQLSTDKLVKVWAYDEFPFMSALDFVNTTGDIEHFWRNNYEGLVRTLLDGVMTGGASSEAITVDTTANFAVNNVVVIQANGAISPQLARITAIADATNMTIAALSGNLSAHADNTNVMLMGDYIAYGSTVTQPLVLPTRTKNTIEQVSISYDLPGNVSKARALNGDAIEAELTRTAMAEYKQKYNSALLFGTEVEATAGDLGVGRMAGFVNLCDSSNRSTTTAWSKANFRSYITSLKKRGAFPGNRGLLFGNAKGIDTLYSLDDSNTGISWRKTDEPINSLIIRGVTFKAHEEPALDRYFLDTKEAFLCISPFGNGRKLINIARISTDAATGKPRKVLRTAVNDTIQLAQFATLQLLDPFRHGYWVSS